MCAAEENGATKLYRTSDLNFSAYLCALDFPLHATERIGTGKDTKVVFVFALSDVVLDRAKSGFFGGSGTVKARRFADTLRNLKSLCYT